MPQSLSRFVLHIVFSTKHREALINAEVRPRLHAYLATVVRNAGCECYRAGGVEDHVHLAVLLTRTITIADLVEEVKTSSSKWMKTQGEDLREFTWQRGYAAFSAFYQEIEKLLAYIDGQEEHHRVRGFQEEYRGLLDENSIEYDQRYMWD